MKKENGFFVDENNNRWGADLETEESALQKSKSLQNCRGCSDCSDCRGCRYCSDCRGCREFKENPERITSAKIGSREDQTTVYWTKEKEQVICGCFNGTIDEFEKRVKDIHQDNEYAKQYLLFIQKVRLYKS